MPDINSVIKDGLAFIAKEQQEDGGFVSLSSFQQTDFSHAAPYSTTFFTSTILACLNTVAENEEYQFLADPIRAKAASFLLGEKSADWTFNYWAREAKERRTMSYPDDLDDTFGALGALAGYDLRIINGEVFAAIASILTHLETQEGGPYRTWLVASPSEAWADVDVAVNSTIGAFLSRIGVRLPSIETFIENAIASGKIYSPYYPSAAHALYFISRFYKSFQNDGGGKRKTVAKILDFRRRRARAMTPLENAITITSLINCDAADKIAPAEKDMLFTTTVDQQWEPYAFCIDPAREGKASYAGAAALTAALSIEALARCKNSGNNKAGTTQRQTVHKRMIALARNDVRRAGLHPALRSAVMEKIRAVTDDRITSLAGEFRATLGQRGAIIQQGTVDRLALGNLYGWAAYDIYDDILDDDGDALLLPAANFFLRSLAHIYERESSAATGCTNLFNVIMNTVDNANAWEQRHCRLPDNIEGRLPESLPSFDGYRNLADRSIGHAMGPIAELLMAGHNATSEEFRLTLALFHHYLIARQLHDDAHDWVDDLLRGRINSVGGLIIKAFQNEYPQHKQAIITDALPVMREIFWTNIIDAVVGLINSHIAHARHAREASALLNGTGFIEKDLADLENGAKAAIRERDDTILFLKYYRKKPRNKHCESVI